MRNRISCDPEQMNVLDGWIVYDVRLVVESERNIEGIRIYEKPENADDKDMQQGFGSRHVLPPGRSV